MGQHNPCPLGSATARPPDLANQPRPRLIEWIPENLIGTDLEFLVDMLAD